MSALKVLFVVAPTGFRDEELFDSQKALEEKGIQTVVASLLKGTARGKLGGSTPVNFSVGEANASGFDAVAFVGGPGVEEHRLYENNDVLALARAFSNAGKTVAAICIAPRILAAAGLVKGKKVTAFPDSETIQMLEKAGAIFSRAEVEADGKTITANGPAAARSFGKKIAETLTSA